MKKLHITIQTNNQSKEFKDLLLDLAEQGHIVTVKPNPVSPSHSSATEQHQAGSTKNN